VLTISKAIKAITGHPFIAAVLLSCNKVVFGVVCKGTTAQQLHAMTNYRMLKIPRDGNINTQVIIVPTP